MRAAPMQTAKQKIEAMARALPEDAQYRLYVLEKIHRGLESLHANGGAPHDAARARFAKWLHD